MALSTIGTASIADAGMTSAKIATNAISTAKIAADAVTSAKLDTNITIAGTLGTGGVITSGGNIIIPNAGNIGSVGDTDALAIASNGVTTFSQSPVGDNGGAMELVSSVTSTAADLTALEITLPTTTDFRALLLYINLRGETASNAYWSATMRNAADSAYLTGSTDYKTIAHNLHSDNSSNGNSQYVDIDGGANIRFCNGFTGDGSDDYETGFAEILMTNTQGTARFPRIGWKWHLEKRHNDAYAYQHLGSVVLAQSLAIDRIKLFKSDGAEFSNYGYTLYKVKN